MTDSPPSIPTPPATTLSPRSPTPEPPMPPPPIRKPLYLIVATSVNPPLGIGARGTLPWPSLKNDMSFFSRVTKRTSNGPQKRQNAVVMGRRTWGSIPKKFRPLSGRWNVVVSRSESLRKEVPEGVMVAGSLGVALEEIRSSLEERGKLEKIFVIGGEEVYRAAVEMAEEKEIGLRILQTLVRRKDGEEWSCDTFFPVKLENDRKWRDAYTEEVNEWIGEDVKGVWHESGDTRADIEIMVRGWEKR